MTPLGKQRSDVAASLSMVSRRYAIRGAHASLRAGALYEPEASGPRSASCRAHLLCQRDVCRRDASNGPQDAGAPRKNHARFDGVSFFVIRGSFSRAEKAHVTFRLLLSLPRVNQRQSTCIRVRGILHRADAGARRDEPLPQLLAQDATIEFCRVLS
jgi:hypothetical protein